jgi:vacuolar-type H+-ATPase subunit D/Vma8
MIVPMKHITLLCVAAERAVLEEQSHLVVQELNTTSQRVNLFEKVKIPEYRGKHVRQRKAR